MNFLLALTRLFKRRGDIPARDIIDKTAGDDINDINKTHINKSTMENKTLPNDVLAKLKYARSFEIMIEEKDLRDDGTEQWRPVYIDPRFGGNGRVVITVNSPKELADLRQQYAMADQRFSIVTEINKPSEDDLYRLAVEQGLISPSDSAAVTTDTETTDSSPGDSSQPQQMNRQLDVKPAIQPLNTHQVQSRASIVKDPVKYYKIGDIEIKDDNGKIYQKQWLALTDIEASNLRVINCKDNKIVNLTGKRFEMKKWVAVETTDDSSTTLEENLK